MKRLILSTILIFIGVTLRGAEFPTADLTLEIHTKSGHIILGYAECPDYMLHKDSISSTTYVISKLKLMSEGDSMQYFANRINCKYEYQDHKEDSIYVYLTPKKIAPSDISKIFVLKKVTSTSIYQIANPLELKDTIWMQTPIVDKDHIIGPFLIYDFYVHEKNPELNRIIQQLKPLVEQYDKAFTKEENLKQAGLRKEMDRLFSEASKFKTVVISMNTW